MDLMKCFELTLLVGLSSFILTPSMWSVNKNKKFLCRQQKTTDCAKKIQHNAFSYNIIIKYNKRDRFFSFAISVNFNNNNICRDSHSL